MGYRDNREGFPEGILSSRAIIQKGNFALIPTAGLVKNRVPGFEGCEMTILASPKLGADFVDYILTMLPGGETRVGFGGNGVESFVYVLSGRVCSGDGERDYILEAGGYLYVPPDKKLYLKNMENGSSELFLYKRRYRTLWDKMPYTVCGNADRKESVAYEGMQDVRLTDLLPADDLAFDMNFHILSFEPGASHGYVETHVQEHGALILEGEGLYNLDNNWIPVQKGDYIFMASYSLQAGYAVGRRGRFRYLYSKDCNRDEEI